jgi:type VI secretion system secreted protein VgrG
MAAVRVDERADFTFQAADLDTEVLRVVRFRGHEGVSQLGRFEIELTSKDPDVDFDALVGEKACLAWKGMAETRWVHGIVSHFEITGHGGRLTYYSARLVPRLWLFTRRAQSRIFQNLATPDILKQVFEKGGLASDEFKISLKRAYKPRKYCVQYRETDFDFASRLMEEEGIFYFFKHTEDGHLLMVADEASVHEAITGESALPYRPADDGMTGGESILGFRYRRSVRTGLVTLREFDFKKPSLDMTTDAKADKWKDLERYDYPGEYHDNALGKDLVKIRLEEEQARREWGEGEGNCRHLAPGHLFELEQYSRDAVNQKYLLTEVQHWGNQPQAAEEEAGESRSAEGPTYHNRFQCIPSARPFRPERTTPRPRVEGPQTAIVTGPSGEEIHTDEYGRVKVRFFWDRSGVTDDKSSCWIRVSQGWGGAGWGGMYIPRVGHEVIVEFIEGDPDRPLITGRVYNGENPPPYGLPGAKTQSTIKSNSSPGGGGSNEIRFEDAAGSEEVFVHAQKDMNQVVGNDRTREVGNDETIHVANNRKKTVDVDQSETIGANKTISVGSNHDETIGANMTLKVAADCTENIGSNRTITIGSALTETVLAAAAQVVGAAKNTTVGGAFSIMVGGDMDAKIGGSSSETIAKDQSSKVGGKRGAQVGGDDTQEIGGKKGVTVKGALSITTDAEGLLKAKADLGIISDADVAIKGKNIVVGGKDQIVLECGSASITLKKSGDILVKGKKIEIKGSGDVILKGSNVKAN